MGMAASQARFLGLTARKTNVEFEGQQINQQRTSLGNQSANYYNNLLGMSVPVPPSVQDYTKTVYSFQDGSLTNNITSLIAQQNGEFKVSYVSSWQNDFAPVSNGAAVIFRDTSNPDLTLYKVGNQTLRELGTDGVKGQTGTQTVSVWTQDSNKSLKLKTDLSGYVDQNNVTYPIADIRINATRISDGQVFNDLKLTWDSNNNTYMYVDDNGTSYNLNDFRLDATYRDTWGGNVVEFSPVALEYDSINNSLNAMDTNGYSWGMGAPYILNFINFNNASFNTQQQIPVYGTVQTEDPYLDSLESGQRTKTLEQEREYKEMLNNKYNGGDQTGEWYVRYIQNTSSGVYEPIFYNEKVVVSAQYSDDTSASQSNIPCYKMGSTTETEEVKGVKARLEKDSTGRYINITLIQSPDVELTYALTTSTITDQDAYNDAMNQYEFDKATYDQSIQEINAKIEIVQAEDRNLELRLKQLDTEQEAIQTEMEAVEKVINKNTESTFKVFG